MGCETIRIGNISLSLSCCLFQLLPKLYHQRGPPGGAVGGEEAYVGPVQDQLQAMAGELARVMDEQLQVTD